MSERKYEVERPYPPDYVSADTLAYRLDCSRATIDAYVRTGLLPKPEMIGNLPRWDFAEVRAFIRGRNAPPHRECLNGTGNENEDAYLKGIKRGTEAQGQGLAPPARARG